jgi:L-aspartate oxidase
MAGNSLLETVVLGRRAAAGLAGAPEPTEGTRAGPALTAPDPSVPRLMWDGAGPFRDELRIRGLVDALERLPASLHHDLCGLIARAALERRESRGVHERTDFRETDPAFARRSMSNDLSAPPRR